MLDRTPFADRCRGRWRDIITHLNAVNPKLLDGKHHPCPWCGGKDRWRFTDLHGTGTFICNQCGRGTGTDLVMRSLGLDFSRAASRIEAVLGDTKPSAPAKRSNVDNRAAMNGLWSRSHPIKPGDAADIYLKQRVGRAGFDAWPSTLRSVDTADYWDNGKRQRFHAMLAKVTSPDGKPCQIQRTFLTQGGDKAPLPEPKMLMPGDLPKGSAVRLLPIHEGVLGVGEGVETCLAATILFDIPTWACLTAGNLAEFRPPEGVRKLIIFSDNDTSFTGQEAAYRLARRVKTSGIDASVEIPSTEKDWADVLTARRKGASHG